MAQGLDFRLQNNFYWQAFIDYSGPKYDHLKGIRSANLYPRKIC